MFNVNNVYHGFKLTEEKNISEINSIARVFEHVKSGARLLHLENDDDNKVFSITFRTTPKDSTGVPHILEHSVLCGSKKLKCKNMFKDVSKSSLNTFMNAMTYPDKTSYPISSRNRKDFFNLMEAYLDAVFCTDIYKNHDILRQEGWRYEIDETTGKLTYNGIVYSEMKGALSSPERLLHQNSMASLFPNTTYAVISGGDPEEIPNLTQEEFEKFHSKFYHPSNSYIYLYGDQDLEECLKFINDEYLKEFDKIEVISEIGDVKPFEEMVTKIEEYSIGEEEDDNNKTFMSLNFACEESTNGEAVLVMDILRKMFNESDASPIKKALFDEGISPQNYWGIGGLKNTVFSIAVNSTNIDKKDKFVTVIYDVLTSLVKKGIDRAFIQAAINSIEFELREGDPWQIANKGMGYSMNVLGSWIYDGDPLVHLCYEDTLNKIKREIDNNYIENFIEKNFINNKHCSLVILKPKKGLAEAKAKKLESKLQQYKETLTEDDIKNINERNAKLKARQMRPNTKEEIDTLPKLSLTEIPKEVEEIPQRVIEQDGVKILSYNVNTNKVAYISLLFDANTVEEKYIPYVSLLEYMLGKIDTANKSYGEISTDILSKTGGITFGTEVYNDVNNKCYSKFIVNSKAVCDNIETLFGLISELITLSKFDDKKRVKELIQECKTTFKRYMVNNGHVIGSTRAISGFSKAGKYKEVLSGASFYEFICDLEKNFEEKYSEIQESLVKVYKTIFNKNNLILSYTGEEDYLDVVTSNINIILKDLNDEKLEPVDIRFNKKRNTEAIATASNVQYVVKSFNLKEIGYEYSGKMKVLQNLISSEYYFPKVRLQGGAYGCFMSLSNEGDVSVLSYRDPNLTETIETYNEANSFLENINYSSSEIENFIIGSVGKRYKPLTPEGKAKEAVKNYICGISSEDLQREKDELLSTTFEDIKAFADMIKKGMEENYCCVVGNEMKINDNKDIFDKVTVLL